MSKMFTGDFMIESIPFMDSISIEEKVSGDMAKILDEQERNSIIDELNQVHRVKVNFKCKIKNGIHTYSLSRM